MATVFITGSVDGLGRDAARRLLSEGHRVVGHARNAARAQSLSEQLPGVDEVLIADLASLTQVRELAGRLDDIDWTTRRWNASTAYSESKLYDTVLAAALARRFPAVISTAVSPGWVATKMGGAGAPDDLEAGSVTQAWLAVSDDPDALASGTLYYHQRPAEAHSAVSDPAFQDALVDALASLTGVELPSQ